jgi:hypothetical protein
LIARPASRPRIRGQWLSAAAACRDDIIAQPSNRRSLRECAKAPEKLDEALGSLGRLMAAHTDDTMKRVRGIAGASNAASYDGAVGGRPDAGSIDKARALIHAATDAKRLCAQDPSFHPWF